MKPKHLIPVIRTLTENGMSYPAAESVVNTGYSIRHLKDAAKRVRAAPLPKERIAEYRFRYARMQQMRHEANSGRQLEKETGIGRCTLSRMRGGYVPAGMDEEKAREIQGRIIAGISAWHTVDKVRKELGITYNKAVEISERVTEELSGTVSDKPQWTPVGAFLSMRLSASPQPLQGYY